MRDASLDLTHRTPRVTDEAARRVAREHFGLEDVASVEPLPGERDRSFRVRTRRDRIRVLKFSELDLEPEVLACQHAVLDRLHAAETGYAFPRPRPTRDGERAVPVEDADGRLTRARLLDWIPGVPLAESRPHDADLLEDAGRLLGSVDAALEGFRHPGADRTFKWDLRRAREIVASHRDAVEGDERRALLDSLLRRYDEEVAPVVPDLRTQVVHGDGNDHNLLVELPPARDAAAAGADPTRRRVAGLVDFGDLVWSWTVAEPAVGAAYAMLDKADPVAAAARLVRGYHGAFPLTEVELRAVLPLAVLRLSVSVVLAAIQARRHPRNPYLTVTEDAAWRALARLDRESPELGHYRIRDACGLRPCPRAEPVEAWLREAMGAPRPVLGGAAGEALREGRHVVFDLSPGSLELADVEQGADAAAWAELLFGRLEEAGVPVGVGRYDEPRRWYTADLFVEEGDEGPARRTVHLGLDLFAEPGTPVLAPLPGRVHAVRENAGSLDYGPTVVLTHEIPDGRGSFHTLYGHLARATPEGVAPGDRVAAGDRIGAVGAPPVNGGWAPHVHVQLVCDLLGHGGDFPGVARPGERRVWRSLSPDPGLLLRIPGLGGSASPLTDAPAGSLGSDEILARRDRLLGPNLSVHYRKPLHIVRGWKQHLYDACGRAYLDGVNNVAHVGHGHPRVVEALRRQAAVLNTNTRYLHEHLVRYAERLTATLPDPLSVCFFTCTGSEANELALRLARAHAAARGRPEADGVLVLEAAYHGNTSSLVEMSPYKYRGPGGRGRPEHVREVPLPDPYRGRYRGRDRATGRRYAGHVRDAAADLARAGRPPAAFLCESLPGCGGQIVFPDGFMEEAFRHAREAGAVCVADEVQVGFGRVGTRFWGFETQDAVPDIVTLGKPMGNGHPVAAAVTSPEIAATFDTGMEYFNTFGGNPASCLVGMAVLDVLEEEGLQAHARRVGGRLFDGLREVQSRHPEVVGDVRGLGLFLGVELVADREERIPAGALAGYVVERLRDGGILLSTDGPDHNVIKIKPPLPFSAENADRLVETLDRVLGEDFPRSVAGQLPAR